ncbi:MAG: HlyD family efflux transporter periplasmic adaptor subunit [Alphaproteobacteria bacterium]|nr:HlyD family efflux transporter periplasmic adaptor subunit [Alphaproteobacteria bacterium]
MTERTGDRLAGEGRRRRRLRTVLLVAGPLVALGVAAYFYLTGGRYVTTDNAYVRAGMVSVAANVSGEVVDIPIRENQRVKVGDVLFRIDPEPFSIAVSEAEADLAEARLAVHSLKAELAKKRSELAAAQADVDYQQREFSRYDRLAQSNTVSRAKFEEVQHRLTEAQNRVATARKDIETTIAALGGNEAVDVESHPQVIRARAKLEEARRDLRNCTVRTRVNGIVGKIGLQLGEHVGEGQPVFPLMASDSLWVEANLKETELTNVRPGQRATLEVDTFPDVTLHGVVSSISPAAGSEYSVLPPQNATGNWVKITQRVPVRIALGEDAARVPLRAGMSVHVSIDTGPHHAWPLGGMDGP